jgi:hypothetical protein
MLVSEIDLKVAFYVLVSRFDSAGVLILVVNQSFGWSDYCC